MYEQLNPLGRNTRPRGRLGRRRVADGFHEWEDRLLGEGFSTGEFHQGTIDREDLLEQLSKQGATAFALDCIPRMLSRGQTFDVLSSQANIAGYRAVVEASNAFGRFFAGQMTAAGKVPPAKVLVLGTGVAGLAAIQAAKNMGAVVRAFDVRPVTKEQVEAMGAKFLEVDFQEDGSGAGGYAKEMSAEWHAAAEELLAKTAAESDIIIDQNV